jgi:hypothetical protein
VTKNGGYLFFLCEKVFMNRKINDELKLILLLVADEKTLHNFINKAKLEYVSFSSKTYSFLQFELSQRLWKCVIKAYANNLNIKSQVMIELDRIDWSLKEKKRLTNLIYRFWHSEFDSSLLELLYDKIKRKTEIYIAKDLIQSFRQNMKSEIANLKMASDDFFMNLPIFEKSIIKNQTVGENNQIYWNNEKVYENLLDLEQDLRLNKETHNIRWVLKCSVLIQSGCCHEKIKEIMQNLGLELLLISYKV